MTFHESATQGDIVSTLQIAVVYGALWAIGSSWATAIREIVITLVPNDTENQALAELGSAAITTVIGVGVALLTTRKCRPPCSDCRKRKSAPETQGLPPRNQSLATRVSKRRPELQGVTRG